MNRTHKNHSNAIKQANIEKVRIPCLILFGSPKETRKIIELHCIPLKVFKRQFGFFFIKFYQPIFGQNKKEKRVSFNTKN